MRERERERGEKKRESKLGGNNKARQISAGPLKNIFRRSYEGVKKRERGRGIFIGLPHIPIVRANPPPFPPPFRTPSAQAINNKMNAILCVPREQGEPT